MLATLALSAALIGTQTAAKPEATPGEQLISKMLRYYYSANTMTGSIVLTASDGAGKAVLDTTLQFEKPSKLFIRQSKQGPSPQNWYITSNGKIFSYASPENLLGSRPGATPVSRLPGERANRLLESVNQNGTIYDVRMIYAIGATDGLADRSVPLDIAIGRREDLSHDVLQWIKPIIAGRRTVNGAEVNVITGKWKPYGDAPDASGDFELDVTDDGRLVRYEVDQLMGNQAQTVKVVTVWDVNLVINGKPDDTLFKVIQ